MITYITENSSVVLVKLDGRLVGKIKHGSEGWRYYPKGSKELGKAFATLEACKYSLEGE